MKNNNDVNLNAETPKDEAIEVTLDAPEATETVEEQPEATIDEWRQALEIAVKQRDENLDALRRSQADFQNFKRRNQTARSDGYEDGVRETIAAMLPAIDNLERAIDAATDNTALLEGVKMTYNLLMEALKKLGLTELPALGCDFDPEMHNAVMKEPSDEAPGKVLEVFQKGYKVKDKIIRYAMVKVSA